MNNSQKLLATETCIWHEVQKYTILMTNSKEIDPRYQVQISNKRLLEVVGIVIFDFFMPLLFLSVVNICKSFYKKLYADRNCS